MSKTKQNIFITNNFGETQNLGENFARILLAQAVQGVSLSRDNVVALYGNLGSGKTTFVQGLARGFGIRKRIISPTFVFVRQYKVSPPRCNTFYHVDLYRIENQREIEGMGLREIINDGKNTIVIEWAEKMQNLLPKKRWDVEFKDLGGSKRKITINQKL
ncbi:MAG: tRNA (adenosine(37)-N6)-threonylcarbamoyltransferase complex ATPase subunit type 1 TsaE [Candidatus Levybacteria bacterium RIFCSPHIGHO2_01_FULL_37_33]|nr:MAG: tRNA (adenosine(37)-N6)-threonylcarbamoyltransferase complex ATPase subunit type 1 TsaE [Candidatus Levybacteria bacterium RIFCSPHIGHO2_01_FULL_37_33]OGH17598.1 MAG: tRNA (adenosine(37)-N6)-threonylcarbamoyltransferase complex ATPase subunit type 1 TsaE [Candidatus Levybacteria bacterium RIFCSPHIGHO2_02_FULL_37_11]OGH29046.1 MAG: tRNA (adenosine(37)-N6)-threonylcarbamoyltransferase complex ATPase subunit type 1 TsaE [Candidatus Levybacteria bacterium RIFCSPHIGHO2_12_FULL_37_12]OGH33144.1